MDVQVLYGKYKRKMIYSQFHENIQKRIKDLCKCKEIEIIKGWVYAPVYILVEITSIS